MNGLVIKNTGSTYLVRLDDGSDVSCHIKGNFRIKGIRTTNPVAVGDHVTVSLSNDANFITAIAPRRNYIIRRASNLSKEAHIIAANIDQALLIVTLTHPTTSTTFIDRFLATAQAYDIPTVIVFNKVDLLATDDDLALLHAFENLYQSIGYMTIAVSSITGQGLDTLSQALNHRITLLSGNSGVGKSTLINHIIPGLNIKTAAISDIHHTGMHTTTFSQMFQLPGHPDTWIIDTPGVKGFGTIDFDPSQVAHYFPEIFKTSADCRFNNCTHTHEPGCAVIDALENHLISQSRYNSYLSILDDTNPDKYRKPF